MSIEETKPEQKELTKEEIQAAYDKLCGIAGDTQFKIDMLKAKLQQMNMQLAQLSEDFAKRFDMAKKETATEEASETTEQAIA